MTPAEWQRVRELFEAALDVDPANRLQWLQAQTADRAVRAEAESLIEHHSRVGSFLDEPAPTRMPALLDGDQDDPFEAGAVVGQYTIVRELGRGAMGRVYLATDGRLGRSVALKALAPQLTGEPTHRERLRREAQAAAALTHSGICTVYALEEFDGQLFIASELVDGHTLRDEISKDEPPGSEAIVTTARELAGALASAHAKGITHRDFKPENVMRNRAGRLKVLDFGVARMAEPAIGAPAAMLATVPGALIGTPAYMAPEQLNAQPTDARTDVFAFGVVMYEYACGAHPFEATTPIGLAARVLESDTRPIAERTPHIPVHVAAIVDRCLCKPPADRFASASEIVSALEASDAGLLRSRSAGHAATWWHVHQLVVMAVYVAATTVAWSIKEASAASLSLWLFIAIGIGSAIGGILRGHLLFTSAVNRRHLTTERLRVRRPIMVVDMLMACALAIDGLSVATARPLWSMLTIAFAAGIALATILIEPATAEATFPE
jgi:eukaryotic-like serine/threonine-protein kinase